MEYIHLNNGTVIPRIGLGTWQLTNKEMVQSTLRNAYDIGYRLVDTAAAYSNEMALAKAIAALGISRADLILSDKAWNTSRGYEAVQEACRKSLSKLKTDYLDIYLIHWPASMKLYNNWKEINADTWAGMEKLYKDGLVRSIGVCNFKVHHLAELEKTAQIIPMINQVEFHPGLLQKDIIQYCSDKGIVLEASSPLGNGQILKNDILQSIANDKKRSVAQICLRWEFQKNFVVIPKSVNQERLKNNFDIFDFYLSDEEMKMIDDIPYCGGLGIDSDEVVEFG